MCFTEFDGESHTQGAAWRAPGGGRRVESDARRAPQGEHYPRGSHRTALSVRRSPRGALHAARALLAALSARRSPRGALRVTLSVELSKTQGSPMLFFTEFQKLRFFGTQFLSSTKFWNSAEGFEAKIFHFLDRLWLWLRLWLSTRRSPEMAP